MTDEWPTWPAVIRMVSGSPTALGLVGPLLDEMARNAPIVGAAPGDGQKVKLVNQLLCGVHIAVAAEALAFAEAMGLEAGPTWEVLRHGAAAYHGPAAAFPQDGAALDALLNDDDNTAPQAAQTSLTNMELR